jgi:hypothetical protein
MREGREIDAASNCSSPARGCAFIPAEASNLSSQLGMRTAATEPAHTRLQESYLVIERARIAFLTGVAGLLLVLLRLIGLFKSGDSGPRDKA